MTTDLEKLTGLIVQSVSTIVQTCNRVGKEFPSLDRPIEPSEFSPDGIRNNPAIAESIGLAVAAATQLIATLTPPPMTLLVSACRVSTRIPGLGMAIDLLIRSGLYQLH